MKPIFPILALTVLLPAGAALADDADCRVPADKWQTREAVMELGATMGWAISDFEIDDGCYEIEATDAGGQHFEAKLDPQTLKIVEMEARRQDRSKPAANAAPAGTVAPPANGLFGNGAPPVAVTD